MAQRPNTGRASRVGFRIASSAFGQLIFIYRSEPKTSEPHRLRTLIPAQGTYRPCEVKHFTPRNFVALKITRRSRPDGSDSDWAPLANLPRVAPKRTAHKPRTRLRTRQGRSARAEPPVCLNERPSVVVGHTRHQAGQRTGGRARGRPNGAGAFLNVPADGMRDFARVGEGAGTQERKQTASERSGSDDGQLSPGGARNHPHAPVRPRK